LRPLLQLLSRYSTLGISVLFLVVVAIVFYTRGTASENHLSHLELINQLDANEKSYNVALLLSRQNISINLDQLLRIERRYRELLQFVGGSDVGLNEAATGEFLLQQAHIVQLLEQKQRQARQFKANRSIYSNSLLYLPLISQRMEDFSQQQERSIPLQAHNLFEEVLLYLSDPHQRSSSTILSEVLQTLEQIGHEDLRNTPDINDAKTVLNHIRISLSSFDAMNQSLEQALAIDLEGAIDQLREVYLHGYQQMQQRSETGNQLLLLITLILFISIIRTLRKVREQFRELQQLEAAVDQHAIVSSADLYGNITHANDKFCKISGFSREELLGRNHRLVKSDRHPPHFYQQLWNTISSGKVWQGELWNRVKGGSGEYCVYGTIVPFSDVNGKITKYVSIRTDLTQLKESERELKESQEKFQGLVEDIGEGYVLFSADPDDYTIRYVTPEFEALFGISPEAALNHSLTEVIPWPGEGREQLIDSMAQTLEQGRSTPIELSFIHTQNGEPRTLSITQHRVERGGEVIAVEGLIQDITERLLAEKRQFEAFQAGVSEMSASILHSIGNIITGLGGTVQGVEKRSNTLQTLSLTVKKFIHKSQQDGEAKPEELLKALSLVETSINSTIHGSSSNVNGLNQQITKLKEGLQDIKTSINAYRGVSQQAGESQRIQLRKLAKDALQLIHNTLELENITVNIEIPTSLEIFAPINQSLQLLVNLINNSSYAILQRRKQATDHHGIITLRARRNEQRETVFTLEDNGCGIEQAHLPELFKHGYSTHNGSGFGLHTAGNLLNKLGGQIRIESDGPNQGATVTITFPSTA
jgi:PAS domain S-box-containing protein